jgi:flagellar biosynthesis protein FlhA
VPFAVAAKTYTVLTVGQGLMEQVPALLIAIAAGLIVTRSAAPRNLGAELGSQLVQNVRALGISSMIMGIMGVVMQVWALVLLALVVGGVAFYMHKASQAVAADLEADLAADPGTPQEEISQQMLRTDPIALEVGEELAELADPEKSGELLERLKHVRRRIAVEYGVIAPGVRVRPHQGLPPGAYQIRIKGDLVAEGEVLVTHQLGIGPNLEIPGVDVEHTTDPIYQTPAVWIPNNQSAIAEQQAPGLQLFDAQDVVSTHVSEVVKQHLQELLTREEVAELLNMARQDAPMVVQELVPNMLTLGQVRQVLQHLVREQVPIKDLPTILNALADQSIYTKDSSQLTEHVRAALGRKICQRYQSSDGLLHAFTLSPEAERTIQGAIQLDETGQVLRLQPDQNQTLHNNLAEALQRHRGEILDPVIVCPPKIRRFVKSLFERQFSKLVVLSYSEIVPGVQVNNLETIDVH